jgi:hypothetical protein
LTGVIFVIVAVVADAEDGSVVLGEEVSMGVIAEDFELADWTGVDADIGGMGEMIVTEGWFTAESGAGEAALVAGGNKGAGIMFVIGAGMGTM